MAYNLSSMEYDTGDMPHELFICDHTRVCLSETKSDNCHGDTIYLDHLGFCITHTRNRASFHCTSVGGTVCMIPYTQFLKLNNLEEKYNAI